MRFEVMCAVSWRSQSRSRVVAESAWRLATSPGRQRLDLIGILLLLAFRRLDDFKHALSTH